MNPISMFSMPQMSGMGGMSNTSAYTAAQPNYFQQPQQQQNNWQGQGSQNTDQSMVQMMMQMMQMMMMLLTNLMGGNQKQAYDQGAAPAAGAANNGLLDNTAATKAIDSSQAKATAKNTGLKNLSSGEDGKTLDRSLNAIANDPEGAKLIAAAKEKGITIEVGDPAKAAGDSDGDSSVNGVTLTNPDGSTKIVVRDPNNIKTIAHELVHATTTEDGNSKEEEGIADVIGSRIANRIGGSAVGGLSGSDEQIYENKQQYYGGLNQSNSVRQSLSGLGLSVSV